MALKSTLQQLEEIQTAITTLISDGVNSVSIDGISYSKTNGGIQALEQREETLYKRLSMRNTRKRTRPSFSGSQDFV